MLFRVRLRVNLRALSEPTESPSADGKRQCARRGHTILEAINLKIEPGDHVAIVGVYGRWQIQPAWPAAGMASGSGGQRTGGWGGG